MITISICILVTNPPRHAGHQEKFPVGVRYVSPFPNRGRYSGWAESGWGILFWNARISRDTLEHFTKAPYICPGIHRMVRTATNPAARRAITGRGPAFVGDAACCCAPDVV
jgi:hypothetical protein